MGLNSAAEMSILKGCFLLKSYPTARHSADNSAPICSHFLHVVTWKQSLRSGLKKITKEKKTLKTAELSGKLMANPPLVL